MRLLTHNEFPRNDEVDGFGRYWMSLEGLNLDKSWTVGLQSEWFELLGLQCWAEWHSAAFGIVFICQAPSQRGLDETLQLSVKSRSKPIRIYWLMLVLAPSFRLGANRAG